VTDISILVQKQIGTKVIVLQMDPDNSALALDEATLVFKERLSSWGIKAISPKSLDDMTREEKYRVPVYRGPPRVLEIGCSGGSWCFKVKLEQPSWIVDGVDDTDHWPCVRNDIALR
jgi:hypothetical protein